MKVVFGKYLKLFPWLNIEICWIFGKNIGNSWVTSEGRADARVKWADCCCCCGRRDNGSNNTQCVGRGAHKKECYRGFLSLFYSVRFEKIPQKLNVIDYWPLSPVQAQVSTAQAAKYSVTCGENTLSFSCCWESFYQSRRQTTRHLNCSRSRCLLLIGITLYFS